MPRNHLCRPHLVPYGPPIETVRSLSQVNKRLVQATSDGYEARHEGTWANEATSCARKFEAIAQCVGHIFDNNFKEAKKNLNSAYRALRDPRARLHLCTVLQRYVKKNQVILNN